MKTTASLTVLMTSRNDRDKSAGDGALLEMAASDGGNSGGLAAPRCVRACRKPATTTSAPIKSVSAITIHFLLLGWRTVAAFRGAVVRLNVALRLTSSMIHPSNHDLPS